MKSIYLILTRSTSAASRLIGHFTDAPFTHVSIAFEPRTHIMYSFARKYARLPLPAGLVEEHMDGGFYRNQGNIPCAVLRLEVDEKTYYRAKNRICDMLVRREEFRYSVLGLLACRMGIEAEIPGHYFCSQFVAETLRRSKAAMPERKTNLYLPKDLTDIPGLVPEYQGTHRDFFNKYCVKLSIV